MNKTIHTKKSKTEISSNASWNWFMSTFMFTILFKAFNDFLVYSLGHLFEFFIYFWCWKFQPERSLCSADEGTTSSSTSYHTCLLDLSFTQEGDQYTFNSRWTLCASWTCEWQCLSHMATYCLCPKLTHMLYVVTALCGVLLLTWTGRATGRITFDECEMFWCVSVVCIWKESRSEKTTGCLVDYQRILHALRDAGTEISVALADSWCRFIFFWACCSLVNSSERFFA